MRYHFRLVPALALAIAAALAFPALGDDAGWTSLFDGKTLAGWSVHGGFASYCSGDLIIPMAVTIPR